MRYPNAAGGLKLLFLGQILTIVGGVVMVVAAIVAALTFGALAGIVVLASLVVIIAGVLEIVGLNKAGQDDEGYRGALVFAVVGMVVGVVNNLWLSDVPVIGALLSLATNVLSFLVVNAVCQTTGNLLHSVGNDALADRGATVAKIYFVCTVIEVVCTIVGVIPILGALAGLVSAVSAIVSLVGYIMYLTFLSGSSSAL